MRLIEELIKSKKISSPLLAGAFRFVRRSDFLRRDDESLAEIDSPISIGYGQTNSQPSTVAFMHGILEPGPGMKILDVGCGSGWTTALLAHIVGEKGRVVGVELVPELASFARSNIAKYGFDEKGIVKIINTDGNLGYEADAPYDRILVSAAAPLIPEDLLGQLKQGGRMVIPVGLQGEIQTMTIIEKDVDGKIEKSEIPGFVFVPLVKS